MTLRWDLKDEQGGKKVGSKGREESWVEVFRANEQLYLIGAHGMCRVWRTDLRGPEVGGH